MRELVYARRLEGKGRVSRVPDILEEGEDGEEATDVVGMPV